MAYMHIDNLYKDTEILIISKECYAMEKIHGTGAHISYKTDKNIGLFSGGVSYESFKALFDLDELKRRLDSIGFAPNKSVRVFGEAYGGSSQKMVDTYGKDLKFVAFEVKVGDAWLAVPQAEDIVNKLGLEFVHYVKIPCTLEAIDAERDSDSIQAIRNGMGEGKLREGVVLRPIVELTRNSGKRLIAKHKRVEFQETKTIRVVDESKLKVISEANEVAEEWVTPMRLAHVLDKIENPRIEIMREIIATMIEDVKREGEGEVVWSQAVYKAIGSRTAQLTKQHFAEQLQRIN